MFNNVFDNWTLKLDMGHDFGSIGIGTIHYVAIIWSFPIHGAPSDHPF
jgi:hypothetical protein